MYKKVILLITLITFSLSSVACETQQNESKPAENSQVTSNYIIDNDSYFEPEEDNPYSITTNRDNAKYYQRKDFEYVGKDKNSSFKEYIDYIISFKNKDIEMPIKDDYTLEELEEEILRTSVQVKVKWVPSYDQDSYRYNNAKGNIYDIDDQYIYIITCQHTFEECVAEDWQNYLNLNITFYGGESIDISRDCLANKEYEKNDFQMICIEKEMLSDSTLEQLKSINLTNYFYIDITDLSSYDIYHIDNDLKLSYDGHLVERDGVVLLDKNTVTTDFGNSGGGLFLQDGTYLCYVIQQDVLKINVIKYIYYLLIHANSEYFS